MFHKAVKLATEIDEQLHKDILNCSLMRGWYVPEELSCKAVLNYFQSMNVNYNSTFFTSWKKACNICDEDRIILQLMHYISTYGTDFEGTTFMPFKADLPEFPYKELKVLEEISLDEVRSEVEKLLYSSMAMKTATITEIMTLVEELDLEVDLTKVQNRELRIHLIMKFNIPISTVDDGMRVLWMMLVGNAMPIKSKRALKEVSTILRSRSDLRVKILEFLQRNEVILSQAFLRNKDIFINLKVTPELTTQVNRLRRLTKKYHKPIPKAWHLNLRDPESLFHVDFSKMTVYKLIQIWNWLVDCLNCEDNAYIIRNGSYYIKPYKKIEDWHLHNLFKIVRSVLADKLSHLKGKKVLLPKEITLAAPTSEKNFIGEIPMGSWISVANDQNLLVGIYWENDWGAQDLDLSALNVDGNKIGWNSSWRNSDIIFSGDVTDAPNGATEIFLIKQYQNYIFNVNSYYGDCNPKCKIFLAKHEDSTLERNYMVDPSKIMYEAIVQLNDREMSLGFLTEHGQFVFAPIRTGSGMVSTSSKWKTELIKIQSNKSYMDLHRLLELAGAYVSTGEVTPDIDLTSYSKAKILGLLSPEV